MNDDAIKPDAVESTTESDADSSGEDGPDETITQPSKLIRIASMTRAMLEEVRQAPIDEKGRARLVDVHRQSLEELREVLSTDLLAEFDQLMLPLRGSEVSDAEIRIAQAQMIGWLEGLFHGIQASLFSQQVAAQSQLAEMQRRAIEPPKRSDDGSGLYL